MVKKAMVWAIKKLAIRCYRRYPFLAWSWGVDENTSLHIMSEEYWPDHHRFGVHDRVYKEEDENGKNPRRSY